jgi:hypothetical protein
MSVIGSNILAGASGQGGGYNLTRSLRFRSSASAYLNRTPSNTATSGTTWTVSYWFKVNVGSSASRRCGFSAGNADATGGSIQFLVTWQGYSQDYKMCIVTGQGVTSITTSGVFRDPSAWYHVVVACDTTQATASNRWKIYVNGVQQSIGADAFGGSANYPTQNTTFRWNASGQANLIGATDESGTKVFFMDGYIAEFNNIDGQALTPSSFGEYSTTTGVWQPKKYAGTYGTNGFYLPFTDNSALTTSSNVGLGKDFSGNGNYWTTNNISITSGVTYDSMTDVPTLTSATAANYCVMNPIDSASAIKPEYANLRLRNASSTHSITRGTVGVTSGKYYWEIKVSSAMSNFYSGIATNQTDISTTTTVGADAYSWAYVGSNGEKRYNGSSSAYGSALVNGDVLGCALDLDNGKIYWSVNGTFQASGDPAAGTNPAFTGVTGTCFPAGGAYNMTIDYTFGQRPFTYTPPTGFVALNTFNLPTPSIGATASTQAGKYFNAVTYTGNDVNGRSVTGFGFNPDFVWVKSRSIVENNVLSNTVTGGGKTLYSNLTLDEQTNEAGGYIASFVTDGFTVSAGGVSDNAVNDLNDTYVSWAWRASNATAVTNTAGSITSTVSANTSSGFSVVTYTAPSSGAFTVGHGLGVAPAMIITKSRSNSGYVWGCYHQSLGNTKRIDLNSTAAAVTSTNGAWNNTSPTSSVFTVGLDWAGSGITYVAYCFSEVNGYSKFTSYVGNGSSDGTFVYCGFKPRWIMVKRSSATSDWFIIDTARNTYNEATTSLFANASNADYTLTTGGFDVLSNGFKLRVGSGFNPNASGETYIVAAFSEHPFKYSLAR